MRKISVYFAGFFILIFMGCGDTSGDPTARITTLTADSVDVTPGGSTVITATVIKAGGTTTTTAGTTTTTTATSSGWGENVTFTLLTASGAQLSVLTQKTDGDGKARTVYTAGNNYNQDVIQATLDNGVAIAIVIKKKGNVFGASIKITEPTTPASVKASGYISIIATVTESNDSTKPLSGQTVEFKLVENNSGATLTVRSTVTDAAGQAIATYRAGASEPAQDLIQAKLLSNGAVSSIVIGVTGGASGASVTVAATPAKVTAFGYSTIQATVTDGNDPAKPVGGETVEFKLVENNSGATLMVQSTVTDAAGRAIATYHAGGNEPAQDVVQIRLLSNGSVSSIVIDVTAGGTGPVISEMKASSTSVKAGQQSVVTITVTDGSSPGLPIGGELVRMQISPNNSGSSLIIQNNYTDALGQVVATYIAGNPSSEVTDAVQARVESSGSAASVVIKVTP